MYYVAVDIGASSGKVFISSVENDVLKMEEVHRFDNSIVEAEGHLRWNVNRLIDEIFEAFVKIKEKGIEEIIVGVDTWGVDYCLISETGELKNQPICYRDMRTKNIFDRGMIKYSSQCIYNATGIQIQEFNTLFQIKCEDSLEKDDKILLIPDYLNFKLTGITRCEITNASTTQLLDSRTRRWNENMLELAGLSYCQLSDLVEPGTKVGEMLPEYSKIYNIPKVTVFSVASHDTASAIIGTPLKNSTSAYLSSGTWSLLGMELEYPMINESSFENNYTNELGAEGKTRYLKNIIGMWLIQEIIREFGWEMSYDKLVDLAKESCCNSIIDVNHSDFLKPVSMIEAIIKHCRNSNQSIPTGPGDFARVIYHSLANLYAKELKILSDLTNCKIEVLHIVGGGSKNEYLNQLVADLCDVEVIAGPTEASAIGNIIMQMIGNSEVLTVHEGRKLIEKSFELRVYRPGGKN